MPADRYAELVPNFDDLAERYGLSPAVAFHILRPKLAYNIKVRLFSSLPDLPSSLRRSCS
jgi:hypothetical protein